jgi:hypothetical protein
LKYIIQMRCCAYSLCVFLSTVANTRLTTDFDYVISTCCLFPDEGPLSHLTLQEDCAYFQNPFPLNSVRITFCVTLQPTKFRIRNEGPYLKSEDIKMCCLVWVKRPVREANHSPLASVEVKNGGAIPPLPHTSSCHGA